MTLPKGSSFRFLEAKSTILYEDLKGLNSNISNETNGFEANKVFMAFILSGSGGRIGIWPLIKTGRLDIRIPCVICGSEITDFKFDPFEPHRLVTGTEDGKVRIWDIPKEGLQEDLIHPTLILNAHKSRVSLLLFHPFAKNILLSVTCALNLSNEFIGIP